MPDALYLICACMSWKPSALIGFITGSCLDLVVTSETRTRIRLFVSARSCVPGSACRWALSTVSSMTVGDAVREVGVYTQCSEEGHLTCVHRALKAHKVLKLLKRNDPVALFISCHACCLAHVSCRAGVGLSFTSCFISSWKVAFCGRPQH